MYPPCNHKPLEPFLTRGMKIAKLDRWGMLLQEYNITFIHIKGKDNILADAIPRLCTINIYETADDTYTSHIVNTQPNEMDRTDSSCPDITITVTHQLEL